ncbi:hypothetical protein [uncultured Muribaculum sp.]|uniref:hypothetical protein n=1 Tax=uncultured Muribaculum sp. TaxID=1918613 RepID=UPI0027312ED7|nr:hypothetical protein [uncultured Muribaculum sp.]
MNKYLILILTIIALCFSSCSSDSDEMVDWMCWSHDNQSPEDIKYDYMLDAVSKLNLEVDYKGGDIILICNNYDNLLPIGTDGSNTYDCGWGVFTVDGRKVKCHFPEDASGKPEAMEQITISAKNGKVVVNTILLVKRTFGELKPEPDSEELPDEYKFKLVKAGLMPFMNNDFTVPAPFDNIIYRVTDYYERYQPFGFPEFTQHYDSIVWCADGFPNTVRIYERHNSYTTNEEHFNSQLSTYFFKSGEIKNQLKGYLDGKVVYSTSLTTYLYERDFLCYDWVEGSFAIANPSNHGIYCLLDKKYEYTALDAQVMNGTRYGHIGVRNTSGLSEDDRLSYQQDALMSLMACNIGQAQSAAGKLILFKCLPTDGFDAIKYWENKTTRIILLHQLPADDVREKYYLHIESK